MRSVNFYFSLSLLLVAASGCSSSPTSGGSESGAIDIGAAESSADAVGSIPEDLVAGDQKSAQAAAPEENAADPFADLKENNTDSKDQLAVIEGESEEAKPQSSGTETYTVKSGDTLMKIAFSIYGDIDRWKDIQELNKEKLGSGKALRKGMKLKYEAPAQAFHQEQLAQSYVIKQGDTLAGIADEVYGRKKKYKKLQNYNAQLIKNPNRIFAGFTIFYDITEQEMAEAEARRKERMAQGGDSKKSHSSVSAAAPAAVPSAIAPPPEAVPAPTQSFASSGSVGPEQAPGPEAPAAVPAPSAAAPGPQPQ